MIVADTNTIAYFFIQGQHTALAHQVWSKDSEWAVPELWRHEFLNILAVYAQQGGLPLDTCQEVLVKSLRLLRRNEYPIELPEVLTLAAGNKISAYDAQFIWLAQAKRVRCVTQDRKLLRKFPGTAVSMKDFCRMP